MTRIMIIGAGAIADVHLKGYLQMGNRAAVVAACDTRIEKAKELFKSNGIEGAVYSDYREALKHEKIDAVSICVPPSLHCEIAVNCLLAGCHVLLEKPMAASLEECDRILNAAKQAEKLVSVVAQSRFINASYHVKKLLEDGCCGRLLYSQAYSVWWRGGCYYDADWRGRWSTEGGGCTLNHAVHHIDLLLWMAGMPKRITAVMGNLAHQNSEEEDLAMAVLEFEDGSMGQITSSLVHHGEPQSLLFETEKAGIRIPFQIQCSRSMPNGFPERDEETEGFLMERYEKLERLPFEGHEGQIHDFLEAVETGKPPVVSGQDGRNAIEVIMAVYKAASSGMAVELPIPADDPFYTKEGVINGTPRFFEKVKSVETVGGRITLASEGFHE